MILYAYHLEIKWDTSWYIMIHHDTSMVIPCQGLPGSRAAGHPIQPHMPPLKLKKPRRLCRGLFNVHRAESSETWHHMQDALSASVYCRLLDVIFSISHQLRKLWVCNVSGRIRCKSLYVFSKNSGIAGLHPSKQAWPFDNFKHGFKMCSNSFYADLTWAMVYPVEGYLVWVVVLCHPRVPKTVCHHDDIL